MSLVIRQKYVILRNKFVNDVYDLQSERQKVLLRKIKENNYKRIYHVHKTEYLKFWAIILYLIYRNPWNSKHHAKFESKTWWFGIVHCGKGGNVQQIPFIQFFRCVCWSSSAIYCSMTVQSVKLHRKMSVSIKQNRLQQRSCSNRPIEVNLVCSRIILL